MNEKLEVQLTFRTTKELEKKIKDEADNRLLPMSRTITQIINDYFKDKKEAK